MTDDELAEIIAKASLTATIEWAERVGRPVPSDLKRSWEEMPDEQKLFARSQAREAIAILRRDGYEVRVEKKT